MVEDLGLPPSSQPHVFTCGPNGLVETAGQLLLELGHAPERIRTERFGPSGSEA